MATGKDKNEDLVKAEAREFWDSLDDSEKADFSDSLVENTLDWEAWFNLEPKPEVLAELDRLRMEWEETDGLTED